MRTTLPIPVEREGFGAANPEGVTKESLANFDENLFSREEESPFLWTFANPEGDTFRGKGREQQC